MIIGSRYKIARKVGAPVFEKTQTQKYAANLAARGKNKESGSRQKSDYGLQMLEKQKARYTYLLTEKQFSNYVKKAGATKGNTVNVLFHLLETRLDNIVYRAGFAPTRAAARQLVSHGHFTVNNKRIDIPSYQTKKGDIITVREGSLKKGVWAKYEEKMKDVTAPMWLKADQTKKSVTVDGEPTYTKSDHLFDLNVVIEFYSR